MILEQELFNVTENSLAYINHNHPNNYGLYNGKMGICIALFMLYRFSGDLQWKDKAIALLDEISENIDAVGELGLGAGLAGIGWGIEWIIQNQLVIENSNEVLADLDDELYRDIVFSKSKNISVYNGALGKAIYFYKRLNAADLHHYRYRKICVIECLVLLTDEILDGLNSKFESGTCSDELHVIEAFQLLFFIKRIIETRINAEKMKKALVLLTKHIDQLLTAKDFDRCFIMDHFFNSYQAHNKKRTIAVQDKMVSSRNKIMYKDTQPYLDIVNSHFPTLNKLARANDTLNGLNWQEAWLSN